VPSFVAVVAPAVAVRVVDAVVAVLDVVAVVDVVDAVEAELVAGYYWVQISVLVARTANVDSAGDEVVASSSTAHCSSSSTAHSSTGRSSTGH